MNNRAAINLAEQVPHIFNYYLILSVQLYYHTIITSARFILNDYSTSQNHSSGINHDYLYYHRSRLSRHHRHQLSRMVIA